MEARHRFRVPGLLDGARGAALELDAFSEAHGVPFEAKWPFHVALDEVLSNIVKYGLAGGDAQRQIDLELALEGGVLELTVEDDTVAFDPLSAPAPDLTLPLEERPIGGLGIHIVRMSVDEMVYRRDRGRNVLTMRKTLGS
jgi:anti-sigma regulatory factor (Ser/Thr protein kinase)